MTLAQACLSAGKNLKTLRDDLFLRFGRACYDRLDVHLASDLGRARTATLSKSPPDRLAGSPIVSVDARDGLKLTLRSGAWLMFRASGTEPILRIYAEAESDAKVRALLAAGARLVRA